MTNPSQIMRIVTWNINGVRSLGGGEEFAKRLEGLGADVVCLQETKVTSKCQTILNHFIQIL